jgi:hypothetical protein
MLAAFTPRPYAVGVLALALAVVVLLAWAGPASASQVLRARVVVPTAVDSSCSERSHFGSGTARRSFTAPASGYLTARLAATGGDWDLAVYRRAGGDPIAASAYSGATEVASGFVRRGNELSLRACRRSGRARTARVSVALERIAPRRLHRQARLVRVSTPTLARKRRLARMGLDVTEHSGRGFTWVVLHGARDAARLRAAGFRYTKPTAAADPVGRAAALPSGRSFAYRRLDGYSSEMNALAQANPDLVRPITLPHPSRQGRPVEGLEITTSPNARDGKPVYLQLGAHHAREWPSAEHTLEWAYELITGYRAGDPRTRRLVDSVRTIIVPVVNPDGFNFSREAGQANGHGGGFSGFDSTNAEFHRKNCTASSCVVNGGVDVNRNYGDLWGGPGTSSAPSSEVYRGTAPFSEPEAQNIRELISSRQVVTMITNHTFGNEILRQPGMVSEGPTPDEDILRALGDAMAAENGYSNIFSWEIGDHVGTTDGWSYYTTGGLSYVFEQGASSFHPLYAQVVEHYDGSTVPGGGTREAYFLAMESAANRAHHAVLTGGAPAGAILRLTKSFNNRTSTPATTAERFETSMEVPASGRFEWHVNQSARPLVADERWTLTCERPEGAVQVTQEIAIARGESSELDLSACGPPPPPLDPRIRPGLRVALAAGLRGRVYRVRVTGSLQGVVDRERCDGAVTVTLLARTTGVSKRRTSLDERCRFERRYRIPRRKLPRAVRRKGVLVMFRAVTSWGGNEYLAPVERSVRKRARRR